MVHVTDMLSCLTCTIKQMSLAARKSLLHRIYKHSTAKQCKIGGMTISHKRSLNTKSLWVQVDIIQHKDAAACSQWARYYFHKGFLAGNQQVSPAGSGQREGITEETMWGQDKSGMGEARSNQDAQESQAWDKESFCAAAVADPHTPGPFPGAWTRAFTEAGKAELSFCWTANSQFKIRIMYFRVELWADTLLTCSGCNC